MIKLWQDPDYRDKRLLKRYDPEYKKKLKTLAKKRWEKYHKKKEALRKRKLQALKKLWDKTSPEKRILRNFKGLF